MKLEHLDVSTLAPGDWLVVDASELEVDTVRDLADTLPTGLRDRTVFLGVEHSVVHVAERLSNPPRLEDIEPMDTAESR